MARPGRKKRTALFIVEIICLLLFIGGLYVYGQIDSRLNKIETPQLDESKIVTNVTAPQMSGYTTYALFGIDQRSKNAALDAQNSDTIIIASINNDTKEVKLASVYRDTLLDIGNDTYTKANAAYAYGGPEQAISMLNTMLDLKITDYVTVNFNAMVAAIDALGGLDIPLSYAEMVFMNDYCIETSQETGKSYTPVELPDPKPENEEEILGTYHLNGVQSVSYCRIRYTASMDMGRTERQRRVIGMMVDKAKAAGITTIFNIMDEVFPMISTSITKTEILNLIPTLMGYNIADTTGFPAKYKFADVKKASMVVADTLEDNVKELHKFLYGADENYLAAYSRMQLQKSKVSMSFSALLFGPFYFFYRKAWKPAFGFLAAELLLAAPTFIEMLQLSGSALAPAMSASALTVFARVCSVLSFVLMLVRGMYGKWLYRKSAADHIRRIQSEFPDAQQRQAVLRAQGGVSFGAVFLCVLFLSVCGSAFTLLLGPDLQAILNAFYG